MAKIGGHSIYERSFGCKTANGVAIAQNAFHSKQNFFKKSVKIF